MKKIIIKILIPVLIIIFAAFYGLNSKLPSTAFAVGDLTVNWGIGTGDVGPIFDIPGAAPGDIYVRTVNIDNSASTSRPVGVRGILTSTPDILSDVMEIVISESGGADLYGGTSGTGVKTLTQFFSDSADPSFIELFTLAGETDKNIDFKVTFQSGAGNAYKGHSIVFDIKIGIAFTLPEQCEDLEFEGETIFGTEGNDRLRGRNGSQIIIGFEGNDDIRGGNEDDCIIGGPGNDKIKGGNGEDVIDGGEGSDDIDGGNDEDVILGGEGNDKIKGGNHTDIIFGGEGDDNINGGNGNDSIDGGDNNDAIKGGTGDDEISGGLGNDSIDGGADSDTINGDEGDDTLKGGVGNDMLTGGADTDSASGQAGIDTCDAETEISCEL